MLFVVLEVTLSSDLLVSALKIFSWSKPATAFLSFSAAFVLLFRLSVDSAALLDNAPVEFAALDTEAVTALLPPQPNISLRALEAIFAYSVSV